MKLSNLILIVIFMMIISFRSFSQSTVAYDPLNPPNTFRNEDNPHYWKNRPPSSSYWQQDVHYEIKATIDEKTDIITASQKLTYWNNSPDTLDFVFFHLYQNSFQPGSYLDELIKENGGIPKYGKYESKNLGTEISKMQSNGKDLKIEADFSVIKVYLSKPLLPISSVVFETEFKTYFDNGSVRRRMKFYNAWGFKHYNGVHWYPRICVYDQKLGWDTDQHLNREFYGDFGCFDVELTFANNFVVEGTGNLTNRDVVLPNDLRTKLDINNFLLKPWNESPSVVIPYDSTIKKTWKYHAENVHDFAFTADPTYRIGEYYAYEPGDQRLPAGLEKSGIKAIALVQEPHASGWYNAAEFTAKVIQIYSEDFGMYVYPKIIVADAQDGMEYPMITLDGGQDPGYRSLIAHEVGHNWFFGMLGSNETYRAFLDEGFTQFLTVWSMEKIDGIYDPRNEYVSKYVEKHSVPNITRDIRAYYGYLSDAISESDERINQHSDGFNGALNQGGGYRHVYMKTATMLYNLQYVLGDELFLKAMQHYTEKWKICHPYAEDFRESIIESTHVDLNWFFDQWIESTKNIDYKVGKIKKRENENEFAITFKRKGRMEMPVDFKVVGKDGLEYNYYIPNKWFQKETEASKFSKWFGWDKLNPTYEAHVTIPGGIKNVVIDPTYRLADVNILNNSKKCPTIWKFDSQIFNYPDWRHYHVYWRPDIWYNAVDGIKIGLHLDGNYLNYRHIFSFTAWYNTSVLTGGFDNFEFDSATNVLPASFNFSYRHSVDKIVNNGFLNLKLKSLDGLNGGELGIDSRLNTTNDFVYLFVKSMYRTRNSDLTYLISPQEWEAKNFNNSINLIYSHSYQKNKLSGNISATLRSSMLLSDFDYHYLRLTALQNLSMGKFDLRTRLIGQFGTGTNWARESSLFFAGSSPEEMMESKYTRSAGIFPQQWGGYGESLNHFHDGGGLNLRGYAGYYVVESDENGNTYAAYRGHSGFSANAEIEFDKLIKIQPKFLRSLHLDTYLFGDAGAIVFENISGSNQLSEIRFDAGVGAALTIKRFWVLQKPKPLTIRFDMPLLLSHVPFAESSADATFPYFKFRWVIGVNRAF